MSRSGSTTGGWRSTSSRFDQAMGVAVGRPSDRGGREGAGLVPPRPLRARAADRAAPAATTGASWRAASIVTGGIQCHEIAWGTDAERRARPLDREHAVLLPGRSRPGVQLRAAVAAAFHLRAGRAGPLPPQRPGHARRRTGLRHRDGPVRRAGRVAESGTTAARCSTCRRGGRDHRPGDAALAAVAQRPAVRARTPAWGTCSASTSRPELATSSRPYRVTPAASRSTAAWPSSGCPRFARRPSSEVSPSRSTTTSSSAESASSSSPRATPSRR